MKSKARKGRNNHFFSHGGCSGWKEYRYGDAEKVPQRPLKRIFNHNKRKHIVSRLGDILNDFRQTRFEHEAACRHGLRSALCLEGHAWALADNEAALLVEEALKTIGAVRPRWEEGQRYFTDGTSYCNWCHGPIEPGSGRFCSRECARSMTQSVAMRDIRVMDTAVKAAWTLINRTNKPKLICEACGGGFHPHRDSAGRFCSRACYDSMNGIKVRDCAVCGETFKPKNDSGVCCSRACAIRHAKIRLKERLSLEARECVECGASFTPKTDSSRFCGDQCSNRARKRTYNARKKALSDPGIIRLPVPDPRPLTPELVDRLLEAA